MSDTSAQALCTRCGLCCDGSLFADVELRDEAEATAMESLGLEVDDEDGRELLIQPCRALRGTRCGVYEHRPECCRTFECKLLGDYRRGQVKFEVAIGTVNEVRQLLATGNHDSAQALIDQSFFDL
jgi:Fe-S-cluster containining protein